MLIAAALAVSLAGCGAGETGAARSASDPTSGARGPSSSAAPAADTDDQADDQTGDQPGIDASADTSQDLASAEPGVLDPALAVPAPGPLSGSLKSADLLINADSTIAADVVAAVRKIDGVSGVLPVEMAVVPVEGKALNVLAVDPASYRRYTPAGSANQQSIWDRVAGGEVAVPADADRQLLGPGDYLGLGVAVDAPQIHVGAYAPQVPFIDAVVNSAWGERLGMTPGNALIVSTGITAPQEVRKAVKRVVGAATSVQALDVVAQLGLDPNAAQTALLIGNVAEAVGVYRYTVLGGGRVAPEPAWVSSHITSDTVPILGTVTCNNRLFPQLKAALAEVVERGLADQIHPGEYAGCYYPRFIAGSNRLSNHAFGLALDLNVPGNGRGSVGAMNRDVVSIFKKWGFAWGGDWGYTDPMHFEMAAIVNPGR